MSEPICQQHIELYVNQFSLDMGAEGKRAVDELLSRGQVSGLLPMEMESPWR